VIVDELIGSAKTIATAWTEVAVGLVGTPVPRAPALAQTPRDELPLEGGARLLHFRSAATFAKPILLVPSLINRWYVLDLRPGASLVEALVGPGFDVWLPDWGVPEAGDPSPHRGAHGRPPNRGPPPPRRGGAPPRRGGPARPPRAPAGPRPMRGAATARAAPTGAGGRVPPPHARGRPPPRHRECESRRCLRHR